MTDTPEPKFPLDSIFFLSAEESAALAARLERQEQEARAEAAEKIKLSPLAQAPRADKEAYVLGIWESMVGKREAARMGLQERLSAETDEDLHVIIVQLEEMERSLDALNQALKANNSPSQG